MYSHFANQNVSFVRKVRGGRGYEQVKVSLDEFNSVKTEQFSGKKSSMLTIISLRKCTLLTM